LSEKENYSATKKIKHIDYTSTTTTEKDYNLASYVKFEVHYLFNQLSTRKLSILEQEAEDEEKLLETFSRLNKHLKNGKNQEFYDLLMEMIYESSMLLISNSVNDKTSSLLSNLTNHSTDNFNGKFLNLPKLNEEIVLDVISQNLQLFEEKLKFLVIGDESVGKSLFISNFFKVLNGERLKRSGLQINHTER
jgi:hypothetical protein